MDNFGHLLAPGRQLDFFREMEAGSGPCRGWISCITVHCPDLAEAERPGVCDRLAMKLEWQAEGRSILPALLKVIFDFTVIYSGNLL